jgi:hypothetical protein
MLGQGERNDRRMKLSTFSCYARPPPPSPTPYFHVPRTYREFNKLKTDHTTATCILVGETHKTALAVQWIKLKNGIRF